QAGEPEEGCVAAALACRGGEVFRREGHQAQLGMSEDVARLHQPAAEVSEEALKRAEEMIEREEGVQNKLRGRLAAFVTAVAVVMSLWHLYTAYVIVGTERLRATHVGFVLFLVFLVFPVSRRW